MSFCNDDMHYTLFEEKEIKEKVSELGRILTEEYRDKRPIAVCILKGSTVFFADLCRQMDCDLQMDFIVASSYGAGTESSGHVNIKKDLDNDIKGRHVLLVEDIIDSGNTLYCLKHALLERNPASVKIVTLLDKSERRTSPIEADFCGFSIPNEFVVGYGLDYNERYRNLPYIGVLKHEVYS